MNTFKKEEYLYNKSIGNIGMYLVMKKMLPNELALIHYDIVLNMEVVDMSNSEEVSNAKKILEETYHKLSNHWKFKDKLKFDGDRITLLPE